MSSGWWELIFLMLVMKLPILYLIGVVVWAVRAEPPPFEPAALVTAEPPPDRPVAPACPWLTRRRGARVPVRASRRVAPSRAAR